MGNAWRILLPWPCLPPLFTLLHMHVLGVTNKPCGIHHCAKEVKAQDAAYLRGGIFQPEKDLAAPESALLGNRLHGNPLFPLPVTLAVLARERNRSPRHLIMGAQFAVVEHLMKPHTFQT